MKIQVPEIELEKIPPFVPAKTVCQIFGIHEATFRVLLWRARKKGIPMPPRRKLSRRFIYDLHGFARWAWEYGERLAEEFKLNTDAK